MRLPDGPNPTWGTIETGPVFKSNVIHPIYRNKKLYKGKHRRYDYEYLPLLPGERRYDDLARALRSSMYGTGSSLVESIEGESEWRLGTRSWT